MDPANLEDATVKPEGRADEGCRVMSEGHGGQAASWKGSFGNAYTDRNTASHQNVAAAIRLWSDILKFIAGGSPRSILEVGSNVGINLRALKALTDADLYAVEPNEKARSILVHDDVLPEKNVRGGIAQSIPFPDGVVDLAFTSGVLIHIHPDHLLTACKEIHRCASRYVACIEYFADKPEMIPYRGHDEMLWKRDFGAFWLDNFPELRTLGYGFAWKRAGAADNLTWWLFEKPLSKSN